MGRSHWIAIQNPFPDECSSLRTTRPVLFRRRFMSVLRILITNSTSEFRGIGSKLCSRMPPVLTFSVKASILRTMSLPPNFTWTGKWMGKRGFARHSGLAADAFIASLAISFLECMDSYRLSNTIPRASKCPFGHVQLDPTTPHCPYPFGMYPYSSRMGNITSAPNPPPYIASTATNKGQQLIDLRSRCRTLSCAIVLLLVSVMIGCVGVNATKSSQSTNSSGTGQLSALAARLSFGSVQVGASQN
jgi:hypothetical protein